MVMLKPTETKCPVCEGIFIQPKRNQGGGVRSIYCSAKCRSKDWARGNGAKRKATILKYENIPENKARKRERNRAATLKRYSWSEEDFEQALFRQNGRCLGCQKLIDRLSARIDHHHKTGQTRGLLCDHCNWAVGHVKDSSETLRNLAIYLDYYANLPDRIVEKSGSTKSS
jgi:hypothetical protein